MDDAEMLVKEMLKRGWIVEVTPGQYTVGAYPPDEYPLHQKFYRFIEAARYEKENECPD